MKEAVIKALGVTGLLRDEIERLIEVPKERERGDYAFPCFTLAKVWKKNPIEIAKEIAGKIKIGRDFEKIEAVGPYVNFFVNISSLAKETITKILKEKETYGRENKVKRTLMIEFSQPNTHKAFHVGHIRGTSFGESLARLRESTGYKVIRANYSGDTGMHIAKWLWAYTVFHKGEKIRNDESWFAKIYVEAVKKLEDNEKGQEEVEEINRKLDARSDSYLVKLWKDTRKKSIASWKPIYHELDVKFDFHFFESETEELGKNLVQSLVKEGIAKISEGATIMDLEKDNFGVWVLLRKDGTVLYSAKDLALAEMKFKKYKIDESLVITSVEQNLHFKQLQKTLELMKFPHWKRYNHLGYESVRLPWGKMSSRTGDNVFYREFKDELIAEAKKELKSRGKLSERELEKRSLSIAIAAMKYTMLKQDINKIIIFNKEDALRFEGDSGPYLLYSYARAKSILKKAGKKAKLSKNLNVELSERLLINELARFPQVVSQASETQSPAMIAHYSYALAQMFNEFYHSNKVIGSEEEGFRLQLVRAFSQVLKNALNLLGIDVLEEM